MINCKHCGNILIMTPGGRCRLCGRQAGFFRSMRGTTTYSRRGTRRVIAKEIKKTQSNLLNDLQSIGATPQEIEMAIGVGGITWQEAERLVCDWMGKHGYRDAQLTPSGADGGVDVVARKAVAQVKHQGKPVGISPVQRLSGVAHAERKKALFFAASGFAPTARRWAAQNGVDCFVYPSVQVAPTITARRR